jgi:hypothetical protein
MEMEEEGERVIAQVKHNQATLFEYMEISWWNPLLCRI